MELASLGCCVSTRARSTTKDRNFGYYVYLGLLSGAAFGFGLGTANGNTFLGVGLGTLAGVFIGWFIGAAQVEKRK